MRLIVQTVDQPSHVQKISNGNNSNEISISKTVTGPTEIVEISDEVNAFTEW